MLLWQEAGSSLERVALRALGLGCAAFLLALRLAAAPAAPANLLATPGNAKVTVTWNAVTGATSYNVYRSLTQGDPYGSPPGLTAATFTDDAVSNDVARQRVRNARSHAEAEKVLQKWDGLLNAAAELSDQGDYLAAMRKIETGNVPGR